MYLTCPTWHALKHGWLLFEGCAHAVQYMREEDFERFMRQCATTDHLVELLLDPTIKPYDLAARLYCLSELLARNKDVVRSKQFILYESRQEAEQALLLPIPNPRKKSA